MVSKVKTYQVVLSLSAPQTPCTALINTASIFSASHSTPLHSPHIRFLKFQQLLLEVQKFYLDRYHIGGGGGGIREIRSFNLAHPPHMVWNWLFQCGQWLVCDFWILPFLVHKALGLICFLLNPYLWARSLDSYNCTLTKQSVSKSE